MLPSIITLKPPFLALKPPFEGKYRYYFLLLIFTWAPSFEIEEFREACEKWEHSHIAYLKEPEFKKADEVYKISSGLKYEFVELQNKGRAKLWDEDNCMYVIANIKDLSHYIPPSIL